MDTINVLGQQIPVALVLVYIQNWIKNSKYFPLINAENGKLNHAFAVVLSGLATIGIHESHTGSAMAGGTITIVMPPLAVLLAGIWHWVQQYITTKALYDGWLKGSLGKQQ